MKMKRIHLVFNLLFCFLLLPAAATPVLADQVIPDDLIVNGSNCVGMDCINNEDFVADTIRLKENNLRIHFEDTSVTPGTFPSNDWRIIINDQANGGANYFSIEDATAAVRPFSILAGAPANALYVDQTGLVGLGTALPTEQLHVEGNVFVLGTLELGSSRDYKSDIRDLDGAAALATVNSLRPVSYRHISSPDEVSVGFIAEEVPDLVATSSRRSVSPMDVVAVLSKVVQEQQKTIEELRARLEKLEKRPTENK
jgi:hypothetical protein